MRYQIRLLPGAVRDLRRLDKATTRRVTRRLEWLALHVEEVPLQPLTGELKGFYKLRVGDYRVVYEVLWDEQVVLVHAIGHRREIYRH